MSPFIGVTTFLALNLSAWFSDAQFLNVRDQNQNVSSPDSFRRTMHSQGIYLARLLGRIDVVSMCLYQKWGDILPLLQTGNLGR